PATTGIMAGADMSGELKDPRRSVPAGTVAAVGVSLVIYLLVGYWLTRSATPDELMSNYTVMMDEAAWGPAVLAGLLGATFHSALASTLGSARILQALGTHGALPHRDWLSVLTDEGKPRNAMIVTGTLILGFLMLRDLNAVAPLVTLFFLVSYAVVNAVVLIEQSLDLVSFRPRMRLPRIVPFLGLVGSVLVMFVVNPALSLVALVVTVGVYALLAREDSEAAFGDVRSGLLVAVAEWAAQHTWNLPTQQERAWKPNLLVPVEDSGDLRGSFEILYGITAPRGSLRILGLHPGAAHHELTEKLAPVTGAFRERGVFVSWAEIEYHGFADGLTVALQALRGTFFKPNVVFLRMPSEEQRARDYPEIILEADRQLLGTLLYAPHPRAGLGQRRFINVWIRDRSPDREIRWDIGNLDLSLLTAYRIQRNWEAKLRLVMVVERREDEERARGFMNRLADLARLEASIVVASGSLDGFLPAAPVADLNLLGLSPDPDFDFVERIVEVTRSSCLFVRDSGTENALA
ncbi:MAG: amino acid permease, partial [Gemmatimonadota bacterium]